jgi:hypothetical protein
MFISYPAVLSNAALFVKPIRVCVAAPHAHHCSRIESTFPGALTAHPGTGRNCWVIRGILGSSYLVALTRRAARAVAAIARPGSLGG